jgi:hypothetical protein
MNIIEQQQKLAEYIRKGYSFSNVVENNRLYFSKSGLLFQKYEVCLNGGAFIGAIGNPKYAWKFLKQRRDSTSTYSAVYSYLNSQGFSNGLLERVSSLYTFGLTKEAILNALDKGEIRIY